MLLALGLMRYTQILAGLNGYGQLNPFGILVLFLSMVFLSIFLDITGFFECWARAALRFAGSDGRRLFFTLYWTVSFLTIFTSNDIVILTFTPFIFYFTRAAGLPSRPYLISEFFAANTWSMMLYIGNPTNILLASAFSLKFEGYLLRMAVPTIVAGLTNLTMLYAIFRRDVCRPMRPGEVGRPLDAITDVPGAILGVVALVGCILASVWHPTWGSRCGRFPWCLRCPWSRYLRSGTPTPDSFPVVCETPRGPWEGPCG
jgi:arsenical pump membrane protein